MRALIAAAIGLAAAFALVLTMTAIGAPPGETSPETAAHDRSEAPVEEAAEMRRKDRLILLAFAVFFTALSPLMRWYAFPRLAKDPAQPVPDHGPGGEGRDPSSTTRHHAGREGPRLTVVQTLKGNVEESEKIEKSAGRDVVVWDGLSYIVGPRRQVRLPDPRALHLRRPQPGTRARHR